MSENLSERRWAENEMVFRRENQKMQKELKDLKTELQSDSSISLAVDTNTPLYFVCECADEKCSQRILLKSNNYQYLHKNSSQFVILPGHNVPTIERVVYKDDQFEVVEKYITPPVPPDGLNPTPLDNK